MTRKSHKILDNIERPIPVNHALGGALYDRHTKAVIVPGSGQSPHWLQLAQQLIHMTPQQRKAEGAGKMRTYCRDTIAYIMANRKKQQYQGLLEQLNRIMREQA